MTRIGDEPILSVVLAGGEGKRLMPLTADRAKPAVPFGGKYRLIDFAISNLVNGGFRHVVVLTQYKSHSLDVHISLTWQLSGLLGNYVTTVPAQMREGPRWFTGSADALFQNRNLLDDEQPEHVIVFGADHIYRLDPRQMLDFHKEHGAGVTVAATRVPGEEASEFGVVERSESGNRITRFHEKNPDAPRLADAPDQVLASMGNYIFDAKVLREILASDAADDDSRHDIGGDIIPALVAQDRAFVYDYTTNVVPGDSGNDGHYWRDVGSLDAYYEAHMDLVAPLPAFSLYNEQWPIHTHTATRPPAKITDGANGQSRLSNCILANGVVLSGAECTDSVLSHGVRVADATVSQSVLMDNVRVEPGARVDRCIIDKNVVVPSGFDIRRHLEDNPGSFTISAGGVIAIPKNARLSPN